MMYNYARRYVRTDACRMIGKQTVDGQGRNTLMARCDD
jgi:hypothetical protein